MPSTPMMIEAHRMIEAMVGDLLPRRQAHRFKARPRPAPIERQPTVEKQQRKGDKDGDAGCILRGVAAIEHPLEQHRERHCEEACRNQNDAGFRPLVGFQRAQIIALGKGINADPDSDEIEHGGQKRSRHDVGIGHAGQFDHDEGPRPHQRRHDLTPRGRHCFDRAGQRLWIAQPAHGGQRDGTGRCDIGRGRTRDRPKEGR
jgi:hypothetical protein